MNPVKLSLALSFIFLTVASQAQTSVYHPFPDSNAYWTVQDQGCCNFNCGIDPGITDIQVSYFMNGDTSINGMLYHKIYYSGISHQHCLWGNTIDIWWAADSVYCCAFREDTAAKKVYTFFFTESLVYDFNWTTGDTISNPGQQCAVVTGVDSILAGGSYRKRINLSTNTNPSHFIIEGIGSTAGPFNPVYCPFEFWSKTVCFSSNGQILFHDSAFTCQFITGISSPEENFSFTIFPNPFSSEAIIQAGGGFVKAEFCMYDLLGKTVLQKTIVPETTTIERRSLPDGIYFYQAISRNGNKVNGKLIVN